MVDKARKGLLSLLPTEWDADLIDYTLMNEKKSEVENGEEAMAALESLHICGAKEGVVYVGLEQQALPTLRLQITGGRMLICCDIKQAMDYWETTNLAEIRTFLGALQVSTLPDALVFPGLFATFMRTGDVLYTPAGTMVVEKNINDHNVCLRHDALLFHIVN